MRGAHALPLLMASRASPFSGSHQSLGFSWENAEHFHPSPLYICVCYFFACKTDNEQPCSHIFRRGAQFVYLSALGASA